MGMPLYGLPRPYLTLSGVEIMFEQETISGFSQGKRKATISSRRKSNFDITLGDFQTFTILIIQEIFDSNKTSEELKIYQKLIDMTYMGEEYVRCAVSKLPRPLGYRLFLNYSLPCSVRIPQLRSRTKACNRLLVSRD